MPEVINVLLKVTFKRMVDNLVKLHLAHDLDIFPDPIEDNDRVIQRISDDCHDGSHQLAGRFARGIQAYGKGQEFPG